MLSEMVKTVPAFVASGAPVRDIRRILSSNRNTAGPLAPLIVALGLHTGDSVRASDEVLAVAADVGKSIEDAIQLGAIRVDREDGG